MPPSSAIADHYGTRDLIAGVSEALRAAGFGDGPIAWEALAPLDQFHVRGAAATAQLAERLAIPAGAQLLDIGCGLGGPARHLAAGFGCHVTGIDLNPHYAALATMLTRRTGLADRVEIAQGDALALDFEPARFDIAWTQHVAMNIADRHALYTGIRRVLKPGGQLAIYDVVTGEGGPLQFPLPWARDPAHSFAQTAEGTRAALEAAGFTVAVWADVSDAGVAWFQDQAAARAAGVKPPALGLPLVMGPEFPTMTGNLGRNLVERRARLIQAVLRAPGG
jgi:SAM-dependent methyltransferase